MSCGLVKTFVICFGCIFFGHQFCCRAGACGWQKHGPYALEDGEIGLVNVFSAKFQDIERFDVIAVYNEKKKENWVKRVIGLG